MAQKTGFQSILQWRCCSFSSRSRKHEGHSHSVIRSKDASYDSPQSRKKIAHVESDMVLVVWATEAESSRARVLLLAAKSLAAVTSSRAPPSSGAPSTCCCASSSSKASLCGRGKRHGAGSLRDLRSSSSVACPFAAPG